MREKSLLSQVEQAESEKKQHCGCPHREATIVVADFNEEGANQVATEIEATGGKAGAYKVDVSKGDEIKALIDWTVEKYGTFSGIFNNAGIGLVKPFLEMDPESYHKVIDVDQHSVYYGMYYGAKKMVELNVQGTIVNTASIYGSVAPVGASTTMRRKQEQ